MKLLMPVVSLALLILLPCFSQADAQQVEAAKKEGKVSWYTSMGVDDAQPFSVAFSKKYPFIRVEVVRASAEQLLNRILTEVRAGRYLFDVVTLSGFEAYIAQKQGLLGKYVSPESKVYPKGFKDPEGYWADIWDNYYVVGYNTRMVKKEEMPKRWEDLLSPKWKGKLGMDTEEYEWYAGMLEAMGHEQGQKLMGALAKQEPQWRKGHNLLAQLLVAGEFPLAMSYAHRVEQQKKRGAPVDWITTTNPIIVSIHPTAVGAKAEHPNTAKLFVDFALSREGQKLIQTFNRTPARPDLEPPTPQMDPKNLPLFPISPSVAENFKKYIEEFRAIFQPVE